MYVDITLVFATVILSFLTFIYVYYTWTFDYWKKRGVPFIKPTPFVGNFGRWVSMKIDIGTLFKEFYDSHKQHPFVGIWVSRKPALIINSTELAKCILVKDFAHFSDRSVFNDRKIDPLGANTLFFGKNPHWRHMRTKLVPLFSSSKMRKMFGLMDEIGFELDKCIDSYNGKPIEVKDTIGRYTTDVIATTALGLKANAVKDSNSIFNSFRKNLLVLNNFETVKFISIFFFQELTKFLRPSVFPRNSESWLREVFFKTVEKRRRTNEERNDLIGTLISLQDETDDENFKFTDDSLVAQVAAFFFAGNETSSTAITFTLYQLALNTEIQEKLSTEIASVLEKHANAITYDAIQEMSYLEMCFRETIRLYPLGFLDRECVLPYKIPGTDITLPKGSVVYVPVQGMHFDPEHFEDPLTYKPERHDKDNGQTIKPYTFYPFGAGPRICIGERYGTLTSKIALVHLLNRYYVRTCVKTENPVIWKKFTLTPVAKNGVYLRFVRK